MTTIVAFLAGITGGAVVGYAFRASLDRSERENHRTPGDARDELQARDTLGRC